MSIDFDILETLAANGASAEQIIAVVRTMEAKRATTLAAERQRRRRAKGANEPNLFEAAPLVEEPAESRDVTPSHVESVTERDADKERKVSTPSKERNNTTLRDAHTRETEKPLISQQAFELAEAIGAEAGFSSQTWPPGWCGAAYEVQTFLTQGYPAAVIRMACTAVLRRGRGPPEYFGYFRKAIVDMRARLNAPLPSPGKLEVINGGRSGASIGERGRIVAGRAVGKHYGSVCDALDALGEEFAREAERRGEGPYVPAKMDWGSRQSGDGGV